MSLKQTHRPAFTLVELLVVIGIIALLISVLLPTIGRARESANKTKCLSNLRQVSLAIYMYTGDNKGYFPASAIGSAQFPEDWVYWQQPQQYWSTGNAQYGIAAYNLSNPRGVDDGPLVKYLGKKHLDTNLFICPSDNLLVHKVVTGTLTYPYSYSMNSLLSCRIETLSPNLGAGNSGTEWVGQAVKISRMKTPGSVAMLVEECENSIDDGHFSIVGFNAGAATNGNHNLSGVYPGSSGNDFVSCRHDFTVHRPENTLVTGVDTLQIPNTRGRGNVSFCDGHSEWVTREYVQAVATQHWDPTH